MDTVVLYLEFLAQKTFKARSLLNSISLLKTLLCLVQLACTRLEFKKVQLLLKSVRMNAKMNIKVKGVISVDMSKQLMKVVHKYYNGVTYKALFLQASTSLFDNTRYPIVEYVVWGKPGFHIITCTKICKTSGQYQSFNC